MKFISKEHEAFYNNMEAVLNTWDSYYKSLVYTLGISDSIRKHINDVFITGDGIQVEVFNKPWVTSTDRKVMSLAFNLFNGYSGDTDIDSIFSCEYAPYFLEAIKIRYSQYFN